MAKHLNFIGIEINGTLNEVISKFEAKGFSVETPVFGDKIKLVTMKGEYEDYSGLCHVMISTDMNGIVNLVSITGEEYFAVDNVLDDFDFFCSKAEEYERYGFELYNEEDDYFDEDDIDSIRDGSIAKSVAYNRKSDKSTIIVSVNAHDEDDTFHVSMTFYDGENTGDIEEDIREAKEYQSVLKDKLVQAESEHLVFNGIEMDGSIEDFVEELEAKGFRTDMEPEWGDVHQLATMHGPFMGEPCNLTLCSNAIGDIMIVFVKKKERKSFDIVKDEFYKLLEVYTKKYGSPNELDESLTKMSDPISALKKEKGSLAAFFKIGAYGSSISLLVTIEDDSRYPHITIGYADGINQGINQEDEDIEDIDVDDIDMDDYYDDI